ncbi:PrsW family intramembrane metalloprotease [Streptantibioticus silvisoli]|uniref:PrsW family intramembrane metalloprotease n=1 Tax=Streptantibioticus silvisoli TaxID=2705255 RepID=A0ABT6VUG3_9ACTN|nr:PrsW family intramembrane metalloprotease [Streptantibioticus silvisoli]MDI5962111.1 PrsW family intramembrane metalloprotease [Streptantibioticus silvisoli]
MPVPDYQQQPQFALPKRWRYKPRRAFWENKALRVGALAAVLALCGLVILAIVRQQTGTEGFLVGLALAVLPVPLLVGTFLWIDHVEPQPLRNLVFAFFWGACAATLVAILANGFAQHVLATTFTATPSQTNTWGATFAAPFIEETSKGTAVLLLFLFRRRHFQGIVDGVVIAGITATGFAFTENILYLGSAFGQDHLAGSGGLGTTLTTFFVRVIMSPFAHPLFTSMTGVGFGVSAMSRPGQARRWLAPVGGWLLAMTLHGTWNGSSSLGPFGFLLVYAAVMLPALVLLAWLAVWSRGNELRLIAVHLPVYALAGWLSPLEPLALSSMKARRIARDLVRRARGPADARAVREYQSFATSLALLRARAARGTPDPDFTQREQELLHHLWQRKALAQPVLTQAAYTIFPPTPWMRQGPWGAPAGGAWGAQGAGGGWGAPGAGGAWGAPVGGAWGGAPGAAAGASAGGAWGAAAGGSAGGAWSAAPQANPWAAPGTGSGRPPQGTWGPPPNDENPRGLS